MTRIYYGDNADRAYERFRAKRDREHHWNGGGRANGHPLQPKLQRNDDYFIDSGRQQAGLEFFRKHGDLITLRRIAMSLEATAVETSNSRIGVFRAFQKVPSNKLTVQLGIPT